MQPGIKRIATKARLDKELCFTSIAHHITRKLLWENLSKIPNNKSAGIDGQQTAAAKDKFAAWSEETLDAIHRRCYKPPPTRRVYIPKPGKSQKRPIALPTVSDKALQKSVSDVLTAIYEAGQDRLN